MTTKIELLPLPKWMSNYTIPPDSSVFDKDVVLADRMRDYARANVARAIAPLQAEVETLRAEVAEWKRVAAAQAELHGEAEDRADKLAEALRRYGVHDETCTAMDIPICTCGLDAALEQKE